MNELQSIIAEMREHIGAVSSYQLAKWRDRLSTLPAAGGGAEAVAWGIRDGRGELWVCGFGLATINRKSAEDEAEWLREYRSLEGAPFTVVPFYATPPSPPVAEAVDEAMVERAAKAISGQCHPSAPSWRNLDEGIQRGYRATARAALQAALVRQAGDQP